MKTIFHVDIHAIQIFCLFFATIHFNTNWWSVVVAVKQKGCLVICNKCVCVINVTNIYWPIFRLLVPRRINKFSMLGKLKLSSKNKHAKLSIRNDITLLLQIDPAKKYEKLNHFFWRSTMLCMFYRDNIAFIFSI